MSVSLVHVQYIYILLLLAVVKFNMYYKIFLHVCGHVEREGPGWEYTDEHCEDSWPYEAGS